MFFTVIGASLELIERILVSGGSRFSVRGEFQVVCFHVLISPSVE